MLRSITSTQVDFATLKFVGKLMSVSCLVGNLLIYLFSGFIPVNGHAEINILNLNYIDSFILYFSMTKLSNDMRLN